MKPRLPRGMFTRANRSGYYTRLWAPDPKHQRGGRERWISLGNDFEEAKRRLERLRFDGVTPSREGTVKEWAKRWLDVYIAVHRTPRGLILATTRVRTYLTPYLGSIQVRRLAPDDLRRYRLHLEARRKPSLSIQTVAHLLADAKCFLLWLEDSGAIPRAPIPDRLLPKIPESPPMGLSEEEAAAVTSLEEPYGFACRLMLYSGVRWGELTRLQASDLRDGGLMIHGETKSRRMRRVPLPECIAREIRGRVGRLVAFTDSGGFARAVRRRSGVADFSPHRLRHTFAYQWLAGGGSVTTLQRALGHADLTTTMRYAKPDDDLVARDAAKVFAHVS